MNSDQMNSVHMNSVHKNQVHLFDSHCHLDFEAFEADRDEVVKAARAAGIVRIVNPGIDLESSQAAIRLGEEYPEVYAAVGVHPNDAARSWMAETPAQLRSLAGLPKVVAIGEIGLDYYREWTAPDLQKQVFGAQLALATELGLPVIVHCRQAFPDTLAMLTDWVGGLRQAGSVLVERPGVLHSFSGSLEDARQALAIGFKIGITGPVTFRNAKELQLVAAELPLEQLLIETDAPFLTPHPRRGERNQPAYVEWVARKIAEIRGCPFETVASQTTTNAEWLFVGRKVAC